MLDSVRVRLTLWYVGVLALVLVGFSAALYALVSRSLYEDLDDNLRLSLETVAVKLVRELGEGKPERQAALDAVNELSTREAAAVFGASGALVAEQPARGDIHARPPSADSLQAGDIHLETQTGRAGGSDAVSRRVASQRVQVSAQNGAYVLVVSASFEPVTDELGDIREMQIGRAHV